MTTATKVKKEEKEKTKVKFQKLTIFNQVGDVIVTKEGEFLIRQRFDNFYRTTFDIEWLGEARHKNSGYYCRYGNRIITTVITLLIKPMMERYGYSIVEAAAKAANGQESYHHEEYLKLRESFEIKPEKPPEEKPPEETNLRKLMQKRLGKYFLKDDTQLNKWYVINLGASTYTRLKDRIPQKSKPHTEGRYGKATCTCKEAQSGNSCQHIKKIAADYVKRNRDFISINYNPFGSDRTCLDADISFFTSPLRGEASEIVSHGFLKERKIKGKTVYTASLSRGMYPHTTLFEGMGDTEEEAIAVAFAQWSQWLTEKEVTPMRIPRIEPIVLGSSHRGGCAAA